MKGLDSGILLALLEGSAKARDLVRKLRGHEVATTEVNLLELACVAAAAPPRARSARLAALEKLRQRLTVLPVDAGAVDEASRRLARSGAKMTPAIAGMLGALVRAGCEELITDDARIASSDWGLKVRFVSN